MGQYKQLTVQVLNDSVVPIASVLSFSGAAEGNPFVTVPSVDSPFDVASSSSIAVIFTPDARAAYARTLTVTSTNGCWSDTLEIMGRGVAPVLTPTPLIVNLPDTPVNTQSPVSAVTVKNEGSAALTVTGVKMTGSHQTLFQISPQSFTVEVGKSRDVDVRFVPGANEVTATTKLSFLSNDPQGVQREVTLNARGVNPQLSVLPGNLPFGERVLHDAGVLSLRATKSGLGTLNVTDVAISGTGTDQFTVTPKTFSIGEGSDGGVNLTVTFNPSAPGDAGVTLSFLSNQTTGTPAVVRASGRGISPELELSAAAIPFPDQQINTAKMESLTVTNNGTGTLVFDAAFSSNPSGFFQLSETRLLVPENQSRTLGVTFHPMAQGPFLATLTYSTNEVGSPTGTISLSGRGINPVLAFNPSDAGFPEQLVGSDGGTLTIMATNSGSGTVKVTKVVMTGNAEHFKVSPATFDVPSGADAGTPLTVQFAPKFKVDAGVVLTFESNQSAGPMAAVSLHGRGVEPRYSVPELLDFEERLVSAQAQKTLTFENTGTGVLHITQIALQGADQAYFDLQEHALSIPENASRDLNVTFRPESARLFDAQLTFASNQPNRTSGSVNLRGKGVSLGYTLSAPSLDFGFVGLGTSSTQPIEGTLMVSNTGTGTITLNLQVEGGASAFTVNPATLTVPQGQSRPIPVTFTPSQESTAQANLKITSNIQGRLDTLVMKGTGARPNFQVEPPSLEFGPMYSGGAATLPVTIRNMGNVPIRLVSMGLSPETGIFTHTASLPREIAVGSAGFYTFNVRFAPRAQDAFSSHSSSLTIQATSATGQGTGTAPTESKTVLLTGTKANAPQLSMDLPGGKHNFGSVQVGAESKLTITLSNSSSAPVYVAGITEALPHFHVVYADPLTQPITNTSPWTFQVVFSPTQEASTGERMLNVNFLGFESLPFTVQGSGVAAKMSFDPLVLDFKNQRVETTSGAKLVLIKNEGSTDLVISQILPSDNVFSFTAVETLTDGDGRALAALDGGTPSPPDGGWTVGPQKHLAVFVQFTPKELVAKEEQLIVLSKYFSAGDGGFPVLKGTGVDGRLVLASDGGLVFDGVEVGTSGTQFARLVNVGNYPLRLESIDASASSAFSLSRECEGVVLEQDGGSCPVGVTFTPPYRGAFVEDAVVTSDSPTNGELRIQLSGKAVAADMKLLPGELRFGPSNLGEAITREFSVVNDGERDLLVSRIAIESSGADAGTEGSFLVEESDGGSQFRVDAGASASVRISFMPRTAGGHVGRAVVYSNGVRGDGGTMAVQLEGSGVAPVLQMSPDGGLLFANTPVGGHSVLPLTVKNVGEGQLKLSNIVVRGLDMSTFEVSPSSLQPLAKDATATLTVTMSPQAERQFFAQVEMTSNELSHPLVSVPLTGAGGSRKIQIPPLLNFGLQLVNKTSAKRIVTLVNRDQQPVVIKKLELEQETVGQFVHDEIPSDYTLAPYPIGQDAGTSYHQLDLGMVFTPTAEAKVSARLKIYMDDSPAPRVVELRGEGTSSVFSMSPPALEFGVVRSGSKVDKRLTITNLSDEPVTLYGPSQSYTKGEGFQILDWSEGVPRQLDGGASTTVQVSYEVPKQTLSEATLIFSSEPRQRRGVEVPMTGRTIDLTVSVKPDNLDFERVDVGAPAESREVVITNNSSSAQKVDVGQSLEDSPFTLEAAALASPIPAGGSASFTVTFEPQTTSLAESEVLVRVQGTETPEVRLPVRGQGRSLTGQGGGCSFGSTGVGSASLLALMALWVWGSRRRNG
ncbi:Abnormal spindle-like microcephaly-assoc'd, ASPM-SPD-2-Hydin [Stigmatella aurantiaca]|uniref:Abnormal spindle-like microcephaly-assoc'd, ASPM-SPD-2-Hydin n=1 Tax=Stigmatella aurantiaca TaxID=41 RepID=A0A1H7TYR3_STIAU|nr:Abnormal spindle-like microcephaly-assoc'd, ASPM-SPD-2-Hydin [Stigmatella aurantiaca]